MRRDHIVAEDVIYTSLQRATWTLRASRMSGDWDGVLAVAHRDAGRSKTCNHGVLFEKWVFRARLVVDKRTLKFWLALMRRESSEGFTDVQDAFSKEKFFLNLQLVAGLHSKVILNEVEEIVPCKGNKTIYCWERGLRDISDQDRTGLHLAYKITRGGTLGYVPSYYPSDGIESNPPMAIELR